jgi:hypothetical protein
MSMSKKGVSMVLAKILFASMLSTISASMIARVETSPTRTLISPVLREHSEAAQVIAQINEHMLSPLVGDGVVAPVGNLDGTIDTSMPGVEQFFQTDEGGSTNRHYERRRSSHPRRRRHRGRANLRSTCARFSP